MLCAGMVCYDTLCYGMLCVQAAALDEARRETQVAAESFNRVRQRRFDAFTRAFEHISREIDVIYKDLTRSRPHPLGGLVPGGGAGEYGLVRRAPVPL